MQLRPEWEGDPGEVQTSGPGFIARTYLVERLVRELRPGTLLDIGCGRGNVTRLIAPYTQRTVASEISPEAARLAADTLASLGNVEVLAADVLALDGHAPPIAGAFDMVALSEVLEHVTDDVTALDRCFSLLRPGGRLLVTVPAHPELWTAMDELIGHKRRYTRELLELHLQDAGFEIERFLTWGFPLTGFLAHRAQRLRASRLRESSDGGGALGVPKALVPFARFAFRTAARLESVFASSDRGLGYVVVARRPEESAPLARAA